MKGTMITIAPDSALATEPVDPAVARDVARMLAKMKVGIGGGWLEKVPGFNSITIGKEKHDSVALCDEDGKIKQMSFNQKATMMWHEALRAQGHPGLCTPDGRLADYLVGTIVVLYGDQEFMEAL
jgi:hypothetical protein